MYALAVSSSTSQLCTIGTHLATCSDYTWKRENTHWMWAQKKGGRSGGDNGLHPCTGHSTVLPQ